MPTEQVKPAKVVTTPAKKVLKDRPELKKAENRDADERRRRWVLGLGSR